MNTLGKFINKFDVEYESGQVAHVFVRGLTVAEYIELSQRNFFRDAQFRQSFFVEIANETIVGWDGIIDENLEEVKFDKSLIGEVLSLEELLEIGKYVLEENTLISAELEDKIKGYVRFTRHISKNENSHQRDSFDCSKCINNGYWESRASMCKRFTRDDVEAIRNGHAETIADADEDEARRVTRENIEKAKNKLASKKPHKPNKAAKSDLMFIGGYKFHECPISWIDEWIFTAGGILFHSHESNIPFFSGGLADQPYKLYKISRLIAGESNEIEREEFEANNKK